MKRNMWWLIFAVVGFMSLPSRGDTVFDLDNVREIAQKLARQPYQDAAPPMPKEIDHLDYDAMRDIRWKEEFTLWKDKNLPFQVKFSQRSGYLRYKMSFYTISPTGEV